MFHDDFADMDIDAMIAEEEDMENDYALQQQEENQLHEDFEDFAKENGFEVQDDAEAEAQESSIREIAPSKAMSKSGLSESMETISRNSDYRPQQEIPRFAEHLTNCTTQKSSRMTASEVALALQHNRSIMALSAGDVEAHVLHRLLNVIDMKTSM